MYYNLFKIIYTFFLNFVDNIINNYNNIIKLLIK